jgi:hypothetical protein
VTRMHGRTGLLIVLGGCATYLAVLLAAVDVPPLVHLFAGTALVLFLPGHTLLRALGIAAADAMSGTLLAVGMSIVVTIVSGLVLETVPLLRLVADDWRLMLAFVTGTLAALGLLGTADAEPSPRPRVRLDAIAWGLLPFTLVVAAWVLTDRTGAWVQPAGFTELWAVEGESGHLVLGIRNREGEPSTYRLQVHPPLAGLESAWSVHLVDREAWERSIVVPTPSPGGDAEVRLYRPDDEEPYRTVRLPSGRDQGRAAR